MTMTFRDFVADNPKGVRWSFAVTITGLPDIYSDGQADWSGIDSDRTDRPGTLATRDFKVDLRSDPMKPLLTGGELSFELVDDGTESIFRTFAPAYLGSSTYLTADVAPSDTTISVADGTAFAVNDYVMLGTLETVKVTATAASSIDVYRAQLNTNARKHRVVGVGLGNRIGTSPTGFKGRIATIWACPVESTSGLLDISYAAPVWAGPIATIRQSKAAVQVQCASLGSLLESDWPAMLPTGRVGTPTSRRYISDEMWSQGLKMEYSFTTGTGVPDQASFVLPFYYFDETLGAAPYFTQITNPTAGFYPLKYIVQIIQDTVLRAAETATFEPWRQGGIQVLRNRFKLELKEEADYFTLYSSFFPTGPGSFWDVLTLKAFGLTLEVRNGQNRRVRRFQKGTGISKTDTEIPIYLDNPSYPIEDSYKESGGYIRVSDGSQWEIIAFTSVSIDADDALKRSCTLSGCIRGINGTTPTAWGFAEDEDDTVKPANVTQLLMGWDNNGLKPEDVVVGLLLSKEEVYSPTGYEWWNGYRQCLGLHERFVDYEGIIQCFQRNGGLERINAFWVDEKGKGKSSLEEFLKFYGMHFVTRQFTRADVTYFGLSLESITPPLATYQQDQISDADRLAGSAITVDHNERLVVNVCSFKPHYRSVGKGEADGAEIFIYDEYSIAEYGAQKTVEFKPTIFDWVTTGSNIDQHFEGRDAHIAIATVASFRWFSALGNGNYKLSMRVPAPVGWRFCPGDHVLVSLTGVRAPDGGNGLSSVPARIYNVTHSFGDRAGTDIEMRLSFDNLTELAPCARITAIATGTITLDANFFSIASGHSPFDFTASVTDAEWFNPEVYDGSIYAQAWTEGQYATTVQNFIITARSVNVLTVNTNLTATTLATNLTAGLRTLMSFQAYTSSNTMFQNAFAHIADNASTPTLGAAADSAKEYG